MQDEVVYSNKMYMVVMKQASETNIPSLKSQLYQKTALGLFHPPECQFPNTENGINNNKPASQNQDYNLCQMLSMLFILF